MGSGYRGTQEVDTDKAWDHRARKEKFTMEKDANEILEKLRCEYAAAVVSRDELERNRISHGASWWDGVLKGLNIAKRVIEESTQIEISLADDDRSVERFA